MVNQRITRATTHRLACSFAYLPQMPVANVFRRWALPWAILLAWTVWANALPAIAAEVSLTPNRQPGQFTHVELALEVEGSVTVDPKTAKQESLAILANLTYDEELLQYEASPKLVARSVRNYEKALAAVKVGQANLKPKLREDRRIVAADVSEGHTTLFSPHGPLTREELDLIDVLGNSLILDRLLPGHRAAEGDSWEVDDATWQILLGLDSVVANDVPCRLVEVNGNLAKVEFQGDVRGSKYGSKSNVRVAGRLLFDTEAGQVTWFGVLVKETREANRIEHAFDISARLQMKCTPIEASERLAEVAPDALSFPPGDEQTRLLFRVEENGWQLLHDRRWFVIDESSELVILRMVDRGDYLAQCNVFQARKGDEKITLDGFQQQVQQILGDRFGQFLAAAERTGSTGHKMFRVAAVGEVSKVPIQWIYYLILTPDDRRYVMVFTSEAELAERFGDADEKLAAEFAFLEPAERESQ